MPGLARVSSEVPRRERGQSSVVGVVLVVGITVMGVTGLMLFGSSAMLDARTQSQIDSAEHAMTQLDSRFSLVALGSAERQGASMDLQSGSSLTVDGDSGWMNVSIYNDSSNDVEQVILNTTLGAVRYENDGTTVAYQGGGVWKRAPGGGSVMVSPPEFHYRTRSGEDPTLTLPLVVVRGSGSVSGDATVTKDRTVARFPNDSVSDRTNPLEGGQINVTVHSDYYEAWGAFFESRTGGDVEYDHDREEVRIVLKIETSTPVISGGIVSGAASSTLDLKNDAEADSYNSTVGPYTSSGGDNTSIVTAGSVTVHNNAKVRGNLIAGGDLVELKNGAEITGNVSYGDDLDDDKGTIGGWTKGGTEVIIPDSVDWLIDEEVSSIESSNNNGAAPIDSNDRLEPCSPCTLPPGGNYYFDELELANNEELVIDTDGNPVEIAVDGDVTLNNEAKIRTEDGGTVRFYVEGRMELKQGANVSVPGDKSPQMWFYMNPGGTANLNNDADFTGVIYGPGSGANTGVDIVLKNGADVFGGLVGTVGSINNKMDVHFDEALTAENPLDGATGDQPTVTYLHVTENRVNVTASG